MNPDAPASPADDIDTQILATATDPQFRAWYARMRHIGGCQHPIHLRGDTLTIEPGTGRLLTAFSSEDQPYGRLSIACGNRRATRCEPCSRIHQGDTYQVVVTGLAGGKTIPVGVRTHPRVFVTFTAPSFGALHRMAEAGRRCRPRRGNPLCEHGNPLGCGRRHESGDVAVGTPICADCYGYEAAVLWNAHTRDLWQRLHRNLYEHLATTRGISRTAMRRTVRISYAKVAEYQRRGAIHFHTVMRFDGPDGPSDMPPAWATVDVLTDTIRAATQRAWVRVPYSGGDLILRFGDQLDIRPIQPGDGGDQLRERAVASYIAKYVTKSELPGVTVDRPIKTRAVIEILPVTEHVRELIRTCWRLGRTPEHAELNLRRWAHQLGYRGHIATKSRRYSTTYTALRETRAEHRRAQNPRNDLPKDVITDKHWTYTHSGHTEGQTLFAATIADDRRTSRDLQDREVDDD
jgi:hypothetical protein